MSPDFPLRILFDDGECVTIRSPEELLETFDSLDSCDPRGKVWVRDGLDRSVRLRMRGGWVEVFEVV
jgi:hypothetical protein